MVLPDPASYTPLAFLRPGLAMVHCDPYVEGRLWPFAPRVILRSVLGRLAARGLTAQVGAEAEYFLVRRDAAWPAVADDKDRSARPCYDARDLIRMYDHLTEVSAAINGLGWSNYANDHEDGNGQFEQNFSYADALTTADRLVAFRYLVQVLAEQRGMTATFMPKPFTDRTGTGLHMHMSLWRDGEPLFPDAADRHGLGLSGLAYQFIAGVLAHAPALLAVIAPTVNSYKRTTAAAPGLRRHLGADGGQLRRQRPDAHDPGAGRRPDRGPGLRRLRQPLPGHGGRCSPPGWTASTRDWTPGSAGRPGVPLPPTLLHAVEGLAGDPVISGCLDAAAGPEHQVSAYYQQVKREEFLTWHAQVSDWETERYLTAF